MRELTPIQPISDDSRPYSIFGQRFITTLRPACLGEPRRLVVADAELHPDHLRLRLTSSASCTTGSACSEARKMSTMSTGSGMSASLA